MGFTLCLFIILRNANHKVCIYEVKDKKNETFNIFPSSGLLFPSSSNYNQTFKKKRDFLSVKYNSSVVQYKSSFSGFLCSSKVPPDCALLVRGL